MVAHVDMGYQVLVLATVTRNDIQGPRLAHRRVVQVAMVRSVIRLRG